MASSTFVRWTPTQAAYQLRVRPNGSLTWINVPIPAFTPNTLYEGELLPIDPTPSPTLVKAGRIADVIEPLGWNSYSSDSATANLWGAWPGDNSVASIIKGKKYLSDDFTFSDREYTYAGREAMQEVWGKALFAATGTRVSVSMGANAGVADATALAAMLIRSAGSDGWIEQVEGSNEPNNKQFGGPGVDPDVVVAIQKILWAAGQQSKSMRWPVRVAGPSIIAGMPRPEGWIIPTGTPPVGGFFNATQIAAIRANMEAINGHFYPPGHPDMPSGMRGSWMKDYVAGLKVAFGDMPVLLSEGHPTLFGANKLDPAYDAYYGLCTLTSVYKAGVKSYYWYPMIDWGWKEIKNTQGVVIGHEPVYMSGFFPQTGGVAPRPVAASIQALCKIAADPSPMRRTFTPGSLDIRIDGMVPDGDAGDQSLLTQNAAGTFYLKMWRAQADIDGPVSNKLVHFNTPVKRVTLYKPSSVTAPMTVLQDLANPPSITVPLNGAFFVLVIQP